MYTSGKSMPIVKNVSFITRGFRIPKNPCLSYSKISSYSILFLCKTNKLLAIRNLSKITVDTYSNLRLILIHFYQFMGLHKIWWYDAKCITKKKNNSDQTNRPQRSWWLNIIKWRTSSRVANILITSPAQHQIFNLWNKNFKIW